MKTWTISCFAHHCSPTALNTAVQIGDTKRDRDLTAQSQKPFFPNSIIKYDKFQLPFSLLKGTEITSHRMRMLTKWWPRQSSGTSWKWEWIRNEPTLVRIVSLGLLESFRELQAMTLISLTRMVVKTINWSQLNQKPISCIIHTSNFSSIRNRTP